MTDKKLKFRLVDAGCTEKDYRSRFIDENNLVTVTLKWSPEKSYYRVYPMITDSYRDLWASPFIRISREFTGIKTPMELEALVAERMKGASIDCEDNDLTINWNGVPAFKVSTPGDKSVCEIVTVYKDDPFKEFVLDSRTIEHTDKFTATCVDYNPRNERKVKLVQVNVTRFIGGTVETE